MPPLGGGRLVLHDLRHAALGLLALMAAKFLGPAQPRTLILDQVTSLIGVQSAGQIVDVVQNVAQPNLSGPAAIIGLIAVTL